MNTKRTALAVAGAGVLAGVVGLGILAMPAGANEQPPSLPDITAEDLVQSVATSKIPALHGKVKATENLGLPMKLLDGIGDAQVWTDGQGRARAVLPDRRSEKTFVADGSTLWIWNSQDKSVTKVPNTNLTKESKLEGKDPATLSKELLGLVRQYSDIKVDGTARVAGRAAYELVLTPKPTERTLLREVRVAVDSETRLPLRVQVLANGQSDPALKLEFTEFSPGPQDAKLFQYTPPQGATVKERQPGDKKHDGKGFEGMFNALDPKFVGDGWDTTLVVKLPGNLGDLAGKAGAQAKGMDVTALLKQFGKEVKGPFGTGYVFSTKVATALVTNDGRAAVGAVPEQVLIEALGQK